MRSFGILGLLPLLFASLATAGEPLQPSGPGTVFYTVEDAAIDAMAFAHTQRYRSGRPQLIAGAIQRVDGGFTYAAPETSGRRSALSTSTARFRLGPDDVASYLIYAKSHNRKMDRRNEGVTENARRIVDEVDPLHRPIYLLSPSLHIVSYDGERTGNLARLGAPRSTTLAASDR